MIRLLKKIRHDLIKEKRLIRFLFYSINEILLVVIGIVIALYLDNLNEVHQQEELINSYYEKIQEELRLKIEEVDRRQRDEEELISKIKNCLNIIKNENNDSIAYLDEHIGMIATVWTYRMSYPVIDEFIDKGLLRKINNENIKQAFIQLEWNMVNISESNKLIQDQYILTIEPYFNKHINYAQSAMPFWRKHLVQGGPKTDFQKLFNNLEFWNISSLKLENCVSFSMDLDRLKKVLIKLDESITAAKPH